MCKATKLPIAIKEEVIGSFSLAVVHNKITASKINPIETDPTPFKIFLT